LGTYRRRRDDLQEEGADLLDEFLFIKAGIAFASQAIKDGDGGPEEDDEKTGQDAAGTIPPINGDEKGQEGVFLGVLLLHVVEEGNQGGGGGICRQAGSLFLEAAIEARKPLRGNFFLDTEKRKTHARDAAWASGTSELAPSDKSVL